MVEGWTDRGVLVCGIGTAIASSKVAGLAGLRLGLRHDPASSYGVNLKEIAAY